MVKIIIRGQFQQLLDKLYLEHSDLEPVVAEKVKWFKNNPNDTRLDNHPLKRSMAGQWAFSITDDIRIVYEWLGKTTVRFLAIGGHRKVYRRK